MNVKRVLFGVVAAAVFSSLVLVGCGGDGATTFKLKIEANPKNGGTIAPTGTIKYNVGVEATVTVTENDGYIFTGWSGASTAKTPSVTVTMNSNQTLTANFEKVITGTFTDNRDDKKYRTIKIAGKTWMAENLNFKTDYSLCYENNENNCQKYGRLYYWHEAMIACPVGWRLPTREDWNDLVQVAGGDVAGKKLKSKTGWNGTDKFGFSALPSGHKWRLWKFENIGESSSWWSATQSSWGINFAYKRSVYSDYDGVREYENYHNCKTNGFSVRCVQN